MLILSRQKGEVIKIGHEVSIVILKVGGNQIRFGIDAPRSVAVNRAEIYNKITADFHQKITGRI